jgi:putative restriction endonuclease
LILYSYRGNDPNHRENAGLRKAMMGNTPLVYFYRILKGKYMAIWPVFIVGDDQPALKFRVAVDDHAYIDRYAAMQSQGMRVAEAGDEERRKYVTAVIRQRLHQRSFRERVLDAYREQCAFCRLRHTELLDAAHIIPDGEEGGDPIVANGLSLCKLHHAAFDSFFIGVRPDYVVEVRKDVLEEDDGPMLLHGLKGLHRTRLIVPRSARKKPDPQRLERRYERFLSRG